MPEKVKAKSWPAAVALDGFDLAPLTVVNAYALRKEDRHPSYTYKVAGQGERHQKDPKVRPWGTERDLLDEAEGYLSAAEQETKSAKAAFVNAVRE